jgi:hypothetical protein
MTNSRSVRRPLSRGIDRTLRWVEGGREYCGRRYEAGILERVVSRFVFAIEDHESGIVNEDPV